jgi:hypothetical protein
VPEHLVLRAPTRRGAYCTVNRLSRGNNWSVAPVVQSVPMETIVYVLPAAALLIVGAVILWHLRRSVCNRQCCRSGGWCCCGERDETGNNALVPPLLDTGDAYACPNCHRAFIVRKSSVLGISLVLCPSCNSTVRRIVTRRYARRLTMISCVGAAVRHRDRNSNGADIDLAHAVRARACPATVRPLAASRTPLMCKIQQQFAITNLPIVPCGSGPFGQRFVDPDQFLILNGPKRVNVIIAVEAVGHVDTRPVWFANDLWLWDISAPTTDLWQPQPIGLATAGDVGRERLARLQPTEQW